MNMNTTIFCSHCGNPLESDALFCHKCGAKVVTAKIAPAKKVAPAKTEPQTEEEFPEPITSEEPKSAQTTLLLCILFGMLGVHRFYVGKKWSAMLMLMCAGGLGVWVLLDILVISKNKFKDKQGNLLTLTNDLSPLKETALTIGSLIAWFAACMVYVAIILIYMTSSLVNVVTDQLTALRADNIDQAYSYTSQDFKNRISIDSFRKYVAQYPILKNNVSLNVNDRKILNNTGYIAGILTTKDGTSLPIEYQLFKEKGKWTIFNMKIILPEPKENGSK